MSTDLTYAELQAKIAELTAQAEAARKAEVSAVIAEIKQNMARYGITIEDLGEKRGRHSSKGVPAPIKYRHPETGQTWSGRGKHPRWLAAELAAGKDIAMFAVA